MAKDEMTVSSEASRAGRGVVYIAFAKFYFMIVGFLIEVRLPAMLGRSAFGAYRTVSSAVSPFNNVLITGTIQAVSRFTAQRPDDVRSIQRAGLAMHLWVGLPLSLLFIALSPVAAHLMLDGDKSLPLMLAGLITLGYSFYAVFVGTANGLHDFHKQAGLDITMATLRAIGILGLAGAGFGLFGAISGWVGATFIILILSTFVVGLPRRRTGEVSQPLRPMVGFFLKTAFYLILLNVIMVVDTFLLKRLATEWFAAHASVTSAEIARLTPPWLRDLVGEIKPSVCADAQVGYYGAVQNLARLPYQAIIAVTFVIFPLVSRATFESDSAVTHRYVQTTLRYSLIFCAAIAVAFAANPLELLDVPYERDYAVIGAPALFALSLGTIAFAVFAIVGTILNGAGLVREAIVTALVTLIAAVVANYLVIPRFDPGADLLFACAAATSGAMALGAVVGGFLLYRRLGAFLPVLTPVRVGVALVVAIATGRLLHVSSTVLTLARACLVGLVFVVVLVVTRELGKADLAAFTRVLRKKGSS